MIQRVLVVPWSIAAIYFGMVTFLAVIVKQKTRK
jgi:hypothetical protein